MRRVSSYAAALIGLWFAAATQAAVPGEINYQGLLLDSGGLPITGPVALDFDLFDSATGGTSIWSETHASVDVLDGVYDVVLGSTTAITPGLVAGGALWLEVTVEGETLSPRQRIVAVPYAVRADTAENSDNLGGVSNVFFTELIQHFNADGGGPGNEDPSEGIGDTDSDGVANFIDPDNDGDGIPDATEVSQGSDINLVTPSLASITPNVLEASFTTRILVTGTSFDPTMGASFGVDTPSLLNLSPTSFEADVGPQAIGTVPVVVTLTNLETGNATLTFEATQPTISSVVPASAQANLTTLVTVNGSNFLPGIDVAVGTETPVATNVTPTSLQVSVGPQPSANVTVDISYPSGGFASAPFSFIDTNHPVFLTSTLYTGALGGVAGADAKCAAAATAGSLAGTYLAWLGDSVTDPASRFVQTHGWSRTDSSVVAIDWADLTDGTLLVQIVRDEFGVTTQGSTVWTGVDSTGAAMSPNCSDWTSTSGTGRVGAGSTSSTWTSFIDAACIGSHRLLCFEQ